MNPIIYTFDDTSVSFIGNTELQTLRFVIVSSIKEQIRFWYCSSILVHQYSYELVLRNSQLQPINLEKNPDASLKLFSINTNLNNKNLIKTHNSSEILLCVAR